MPIPQPSTAIDPAGIESLDALVAIMQAATQRLEEIVEDMRTGTYRRRYLHARIRESNEIISALLSFEGGRPTGEVYDWARAHFPDVFRSGAVRAARDLAGQAFTVRTSRISTAALDAVVRRYLEPAYDVVVQLHANTIRASRVVLSEAGFGQEIAEGLIGGLPRRTVSAELRRAVRRAVSGAVGEEIDLTHVEVGGRSYTLDYWSEMHARTESARAATAGTRTLGAENGVRHVMVTTHAHSPCICTPFEGRVYALDQGDERFPWVGILPGGGCPMHPNCVHREAPAVLEYMEERGELDGRDTIPAAFEGLQGADLARAVRQARPDLEPYARDREGVMPLDFRVGAAA